jgi:hypothetical protein
MLGKIDDTKKVAGTLRHHVDDRTTVRRRAQCPDTPAQPGPRGTFGRRRAAHSAA